MEKESEPQRGFFSLIDNDLSKEATPNSSNVGSARSCYITNLLKIVESDCSSSSLARFVCEDESVVALPLPILSLVSPALAAAVSVAACCGSEVTIHVPCSEATFKMFKELLFNGEISEIDTSDESLLNDFLKSVGLDWSIIKEIVEEEDNCFIGDSFEDEDEEGTLEESSMQLLWKPSSKDDSVIKCYKQKCSKLCKNDCDKVIKSWSEDKIHFVKNVFKGDTSVMTKSKMLSHLAAQGNVGATTEGFVILNHLFCLKFLSHLSGHSLYLLRTVLEDYWKDVRRYEHGNKGVLKTQSAATTGFICWFKSFLSLYGQSAPDEEVIIISYWLKGKVLYKMYLDESPKPHIKLTTFYQHLKKYFGPKRMDHSLPCHRISKYSSHSICDICVALNTTQKMSKSEAELMMAKSLRNQHRIDFGLARRTIESLRQAAIDFPNDSLFIQLDGMDNSKSYVPRFLENSKKLVGTERLPSKISGAIMWSGLYEDKRKDIFYINHDHFGKYLVHLRILNIMKVL